MHFWGFFHYNKRKSIHRKTQGEQAEKPAFSPYFSKVRAKCVQIFTRPRAIKTTVMATIKIHLDTRNSPKNGHFPIALKVSHNREHRNIPTGLRAKKSEFSEKGGQYRNNPKGNAKLLEQLQLYNQRLQEIPVQKLKQLTAQQLKLTLLQSESNQEVTMYIFWQREIEHLYQTGRTGNATVYKNSLSVLEKINNLHKPFSEFVFKDILDIERRLYERKLTVNTVGVYMRALKAICNKAIKQELVDQAWYPFYKYTIKRGKTTPRVLTLEEMKRFVKLEVSSENKFLYSSWRIGKLINKYLKQLGEMANTQEPVTTYVFRYTYSNIAKQLGFSKDIIAEALGHEYGNAVTGIYLELFDNEVLDNMHEQVCRKVFG